mgnify:CR=1 FL=1
MKLATRFFSAAFLFLLMSSPGWTANLNAKCEGSGLFADLELDTIFASANPPELNRTSRLPLTLYEIFVGEPVGRPSFVAIIVESHDGRDCYILEDNASETGGLGEGFGGVMVEQAFSFHNEQTGATHLFVPVRDYTFATGDETYTPRFVEIRVEGTDDLSLSIAQ